MLELLADAAPDVATQDDLQRLADSLRSPTTLALGCWSVAASLLGGLTAQWKDDATRDRRRKPKTARSILSELSMSVVAGLLGTSLTAAWLQHGLFFLAANYLFGFSGVYIIQTALAVIRRKADRFLRSDETENDS